MLAAAGRGTGHLRQLPHPNIVKLVGLHQTDRGPGIVMESMEGGTIGRGGNLKAGPIANALLVKTLARHVACALQHFEAKRIVHRDIKGDNIMLGQGDALGQVKVVDFGEAVQLKSEAKLGKLQRLHHPVGTPGFMAPEVAYQYKDDDLAVGTNVHVCDIENEALDRHLLFDERRKTNSVVANSCFICNCTQARLPQVWSKQDFGHSATETPLIHACACMPLKCSQGQPLPDETVFGHRFSAVRTVFAHELCMQKYAFYTALLVAPFDKWLGGVNLSNPRCEDCKCIKTDYPLETVMKVSLFYLPLTLCANPAHDLTCLPSYIIIMFKHLREGSQRYGRCARQHKLYAHLNLRADGGYGGWRADGIDVPTRS